ncbi:FliI/YscN family ATPase [Aquincola sp. S2]|uniref:FliI/YscN family ATPase n=1 Tax=Pseudaquabacterium terrae TaxID=2732868 RepID=A0ABX2EF84_9BURK|nr:FliI/YscN family ATPase [Aquabacterium terrae]NRF67255.1 FliI/YscN family ATPase [Aquabacterium terrae]
MSEVAIDTTQRLLRTLQATRTVVEHGRVVQAGGTVLRATGLRARIGHQCRIVDPARPDDISDPLLAEVIGFAGPEVILAPYGPLQGVAVGAAVQALADEARVPCGPALLGRVIDAFGRPLDGRPLEPGPDLMHTPLYAPAPPPLQRRGVDDPLPTGVRAIDAALTVGIGQRIGIFAMAGGGKSTLLGMLARQAEADVNVIALVGERGREVREFIDESLGEQGLARSVVVVSTSDRPALERVRAAIAATAIAEGFRAQGKRVLLLVDSVTRFARGLRELGLSAMEPPVRRGYPPSVFAELPRLFERAGNDAHGSITAFYTVLAEDDDNSDPVAEEVRSILDGHIVLSRALAQAHHYPAIDVLGSASRVFTRVAAPAHRQAASRLRALMARHAEVEFLLRVGEYQAGSDPLADQAIERMPAIKALLTQGSDEATVFGETIAALQQVAE